MRFRVVDVQEDRMTVEWQQDDGTTIDTVSYPVPLDKDGNILTGTALSDWAQARWKVDVEPKLAAAPSVEDWRAALIADGVMDPVRKE